MSRHKHNSAYKRRLASSFTVIMDNITYLQFSVVYILRACGLGFSPHGFWHFSIKNGADGVEKFHWLPLFQNISVLNYLVRRLYVSVKSSFHVNKIYLVNSICEPVCTCILNMFCYWIRLVFRLLLTYLPWSSYTDLFCAHENSKLTDTSNKRYGYN